ncbi:MAG: adenosylcobinamide-phosphate synthase CbiB [Fibrobacterales bacterium]
MYTTSLHIGSEHLLMIIIIISAFLWDQIVGDQKTHYHPIGWIGIAINQLTRFLYPKNNTPFLSTVLGILIALSIIIGTFVAVYSLMVLSGYVSLVLNSIVSVILIGTALSSRSLIQEAQKIHGLLESHNLIEARKSLSMIVGRDTHDLNESEICRATIETVAESFTDGVLSPLMYAALFGPIGIWCIKAISTLDSMIGYNNDTYQYFGKCSARLDDAVHFIPARVSIMVISIASFVKGHTFANPFITGLHYRLNHPSPNSAHSEAAFAGALQVRLGGTSLYNGIQSKKQYLGDGRAALTISDVKASIQLLKTCNAIALICCLPLSTISLWI